MHEDGGPKKSGDVWKWEKKDFDRIDILKIAWSGNTKKATILPSKIEGLDGEFGRMPA